MRPLEVEKVYRLNKVLITLSWVLSFISSIPQVSDANLHGVVSHASEHSSFNNCFDFFSKVIVFEVLSHPRDETFKQCVTFGKFVSHELKLIYNLYHFVGCYGAPLVIMIYCYAKIFLTIKWHSKSNKGHEDGSLRIKGSKKSYKATRSADEKSNYASKSINEQIEHLYGEKYEDENRSKLSEKKLIRREVKSLIKKGEARTNEDSVIRRNTNNTFRRAKYKTLKLSILIGKTPASNIHACVRDLFG